MKRPQVSPAEYLSRFYSSLGNQEFDFRNHNLHQLAISEISGTSILDIGCGAGHLLHCFSQRGKEVQGIEPNQDLINLAKRLYPDIFILHGAAEDIGKIRKKADAITMMDVLEHIKDDVSMMKKVYNYLPPSGQFIVSVPAFPLLFGRRDRVNGHFRRYTRKELISKLKNAGFIVKRTRYWNMLGFLPYLLYERILKKELNTRFRRKQTGFIAQLASKALDAWFRLVENNLNAGFGLSLFCVAEKIQVGKGFYNRTSLSDEGVKWT